MTIRNEALISRYFDRQMTSTEEQNFLISLAASDELRLAFRSHLEMMKAIRDDKHSMQPIAQVRGRTLAALGLSAAATAPFLEHALLHSNSAKAATPQSGSLQSAASKPTLSQTSSPTMASSGGSIATPQSFFSRFAGKFLLTGSGLAIGFLAASLLFSSPQIHTAEPLSGLRQSTPATVPTQAARPVTVTSEEPKSTLVKVANHSQRVAVQSEKSPIAVKPVAVVNENGVPSSKIKSNGMSIKTTIGDSTEK